MRRQMWIGAVVLVCALAAHVAAACEVGPQLQQISVNVLCGSSQGSGTIVLTEVEGKPSTWVLTAAHVVAGHRRVKDIVGSDGEERKQITYKDAQIIQEQVAGGRVVGELKYDAKVVNVDRQRDIALLRVRIDKFTDSGATFYLDDDIPQAGTPLFHCGAPGGKEVGGTCSLTTGIVSRIGVRIPEFGGSEHGVFDQTDAAALPGSSGGLVALRDDGRWIGMITLGIQGGDSFHWIVPIRSVRQWAKELHLEWLLDPKAPRPTQADIDKIPLEMDRAGFASDIKPAAEPVTVTHSVAPGE